MEAIILLGHGSRAPGAAKDMERIAESLKRKLGASLVRSANMSLAKPGLEEVLEETVAAGAKRILVIPYFLHLGMHMRADIPSMLHKFCAAHPDLKVILGKHLGFDEALVDLVAKRIGESRGLPDVRTIEAEDEPDEAHHDSHSPHTHAKPAPSEKAR